MEEECLKISESDLREDLALPTSRGSLLDLEISHCVLPAEFPSDWASGLKKLQKLRIIECNLKVVPPLHDLVALEELDLRHNGLRFVDLPPLANLRILDIRNNRVDRMIHLRSLSLQKQLAFLHIGSNPILSSRKAAYQTLRARLLSQCPTLERLDDTVIRRRPPKVVSAAVPLSSPRRKKRKPAHDNASTFPWQTPSPQLPARSLTLTPARKSASAWLDPRTEPLRSLLGSRKSEKRTCRARTIERLSQPHGSSSSPHRYKRALCSQDSSSDVAFGCSVAVPQRLSFPNHFPTRRRSTETRLLDDVERETPLLGDDGSTAVTEVDLASCRLWCVEAEESLLTLQVAHSLMQREGSSRDMVPFLTEKGLDGAIPGPPPPLALQALKALRQTAEPPRGWDMHLLSRVETCLSELHRRVGGPWFDLPPSESLGFN